MGAWDSYGSWWVHSNFVIRVPPEINTHLITTFTTTEGEVLITVYPSINGSACLVSMRNKLVAQPRTIYHEIFWPYSCRRQWEIFHPRRRLTPSMGLLALLHDKWRDDDFFYNILHYQSLVSNSIWTDIVIHGLWATIISFPLIW